MKLKPPPYPWAATRDASIGPHILRRRPHLRLHVGTHDGTSHCDDHLTLDENTALPLHDVPQWMRCQRPGCRKHWPTPPPTTQ